MKLCNYNEKYYRKNLVNNMAYSNSQMSNKQAKAALDKLKTEVASEIGVNLKQGYNGNQAHRQHRYRKRTGPFVEKWQVQADDTYKCKYQCDG